jgi:hypothetical protein
MIAYRNKISESNKKVLAAETQIQEQSQEIDRLYNEIDIAHGQLQEIERQVGRAMPSNAVRRQQRIGNTSELETSRFIDFANETINQTFNQTYPNNDKTMINNESIITMGSTEKNKNNDNNVEIMNNENNDEISQQHLENDPLVRDCMNIFSTLDDMSLSFTPDFMIEKDGDLKNNILNDSLINDQPSFEGKSGNISTSSIKKDPVSLEGGNKIEDEGKGKDKIESNTNVNTNISTDNKVESSVQIIAPVPISAPVPVQSSVITQTQTQTQTQEQASKSMIATIPPPPVSNIEIIKEEVTENVTNDVTEGVNKIEEIPSSQENTPIIIKKEGEEEGEEKIKITHTGSAKSLSEKDGEKSNDSEYITDESDKENEIIKAYSENRKSALQPISENELLTDTTLKTIKQDDVTNISSIESVDENTHRIRKNRSLLSVFGKRNKKGKSTHRKNGSIASEHSSILNDSPSSQSVSNGKKKKKASSIVSFLMTGKN